MRTSSTLVLAGLVALACSQPEGGTSAGAAVDTAQAKAGIDSTRSRYSALQIAGDAAGLAQLHTETATLDVYGIPRTKGRTAIEAGYQADLGVRKFTVSEITPIQVFVRANDMASEIGTYHGMFTAAGTTTHEWGRYVVGLQKGADGVWRLDYLMSFPDSTK
jgi:uncharacterized protein (TIGR02246 family)